MPTLNMAEAELDTSCFKEIPLKALSPRTRRQLSSLLNRRTYLPSEDGYCRDWRGIAALTDQKDFFDESAICGQDPTNLILEEWYRINPEKANFENLQRILGQIDRWDASDDILENLVEDAKNYKTKLKNIETRAAALAERKENIEPKNTNNHMPPAESDLDVLTIDDARLHDENLPPQIYDAFLLYVDCDAAYAAEIKHRLEEDSKYNYKICTKDDILATGKFVHKVMTQLIDQRCNRLIVILTKEFRKSPENDFYMNHTQAGAIENHQIKLIPLVYDDDVEIPRTLKHILHLRPSSYNFWPRLAGSVRNIAINANKTALMSSTPARPQLELTNLPTPPVDIPSINITPAQDENDAPMLVSSAPTASAARETRYLKKHTIANGNHLLNNNNHIHSSSNQNLNNNGHINHKNQLNNSKNDTLGTKLKGFVLRHAHSTSQLNAKSYKETNVSSSDVSISSQCSDTQKIKKKKKFSTKFLKRVFSRSNQKLQVAV